MAENELEPPALGVAWDGTGFGPDGTVWGGEFFDVTEQGCVRIAHLRQFRLPGGDAAVKEPRRSAAGMLFEVFGHDFLKTFERVDSGFTAAEKSLLSRMLAGGINSPLTSSAGRLFDAVASLIGIRQITRHEGQAAMELEFAAAPGVITRSYPAAVPQSKADFPSTPHSRSPGSACGHRAMPLTVLDWEPMVRAILEDASAGVPAAQISAAFHNTLVEWIVFMARRAGRDKVVLSGGCFQNSLLLENAISRLSGAGFKPFWHQRVPPNDGGIALGQVIAAIRMPFLHEDGTQSSRA
jgi:hydrogenase maturation protein HypF